MITEEFLKTFTSVAEGHEGNKLKIYDDGFGVPTIGIGFALINKISDKWIAYDHKEIQEKGIDLTIEQYEIIKDYAKAKTDGDDISGLRSKLNNIDITITSETARKLLQYSIQHKYGVIKDTIGEDRWDQLNLAQQVGVMDHAFQRGNILSLKESLIAGDYATTAKIMREVPKDNVALKHRAGIRADFVEHGKMEFDGVHIVQAGDTASRIAKSSGISLKELKEFNPDISNIDKISVGQKIRIAPPIKQDDKDDTVSTSSAGASNIDLPSTLQLSVLDEMLANMHLKINYLPIKFDFSPITECFQQISTRNDTELIGRSIKERLNAIEKERIDREEAENKAFQERFMKDLNEKIQKLEAKLNRVDDIKKRMLDEISTKFEKLVEGIKAKIEKEYGEETENINRTKDLQLKIRDTEQQLNQKTSNAEASCAAMAQSKQAEHDQEARQEIAALTAALLPGESLYYVSTAIRARKQAELDAFRAAQQAQLNKIRSNIVDEVNKNLKEYKEMLAQIQAKINTKNEKINTIAQKYDQKIHEFVENTGKYIEEIMDNDGNVENVIEQQINTFLQGAAADLSIID